ncbi:MAG: ABC transporter ATP-binding protein [Promethearchaeota archaeon]
MSSSKKIAIEAHNLTKRFDDVVAVDRISFKINEGEIVGILGPNGAGKTTTIRLITGIFKLENEAKVMIYSQDLTNSPKQLKKQFGIVPEVSNAYSNYTVLQNFIFFGTIYGLSKKRITARTSMLLERFELKDKMHTKIKALSKGLRQRVNLCLALLHEPLILILDEPTSGLDPMSVGVVRKQILDLKEEGKTILITTHNMQEAQQVCDRILIMNHGKIIADESPDDLRKKFKPSSTLLFKVQGSLSVEQKNDLKTFFNIIEESNNRISIISNNPLEDISKLNEFINKNKINISDFALKETSLEEVFIHLIKTDSHSNGGVHHEI